MQRRQSGHGWAWARPREALARWGTVLLLGGAAAIAGAQAPAPGDAETVATRAAQARLADSDTLLALTNEGAVLYAQDAVKLSGGEPANFLDVGGGASADQVAKAFTLVTADPAVEAILINIFGGITRGDVVAQGIRDALGRVTVDVPIVVRLSGTNAIEGQAILAEAGITAVDSMDEAARKVVESVAHAA